ncbi:hypothetical protein NDU88_001557 [Pleurodeles waltl]|uniref:Uncharacterized protein n=1 Tax=Pleurodeles waltl TaxID=8319 RepID=A0AAV7VA16_PLEWA|nr:hypothetical protein NDU88_001557 [Pleurodeles waltl]
MGHGKPPPPVAAQTKMDLYMVPASVNKETAEAPHCDEPAQYTAYLKTIIKSIQDSQEMVETKVDGLHVEFLLLHHDLRKVAKRVAETETRISATKDNIVTLKRQVSKLMSTYPRRESQRCQESPKE